MRGELSIQGSVPAASGAERVLGWIERSIAAGLFVLAVYLATTEPLNWFPYVAAGIAGTAMLLVRWPYGALLTLMVAAAIPRFSMTISKWHTEAEHLTLFVCGVLLLMRLHRGTQRWKRLERADFLLIGFLAMNYVSSYVDSPDRAATLRWALLQTIAISAFFLIRQLIDSERQFLRSMKILLCVGAGEALFGFFCFASFLLFRTSLGVTQFSYLSFMPGVHGSQWEPNIFGSYTACFAVMFLFYFFAARQNNGWYLLGFLISTLAVLLSLARQGWACVAIVGPLIVFQTHRGKAIQWKRLAPFAAGVVIALVAAITLMRDLPERLATLAVSTAVEDPTVVHRLKFLAFAVDDIRAHPLIGLGTSSFQLLYTDEDDFGEGPAWLGSLFVRIVHDTGLVGLAVYFWFLSHLARRAWRILRSPIRSETDIAVGALSAGVIVMLMAYQLTDASTLAFTWIHFGMLATSLGFAEVGSAISR